MTTRESLFFKAIIMSLLTFCFLGFLYFLNNAIYSNFINPGRNIKFESPAYSSAESASLSNRLAGSEYYGQAADFGSSIYDDSNISKNFLVDGSYIELRNQIHAQRSKIWLSSLFGSLVFFLVIRYWARSKQNNLLELSVLFSSSYFLIDLVYALACGNKWSEISSLFIVSNGAKLLGAAIAFYLYYAETRTNSQ